MGNMLTFGQPQAKENADDLLKRKGEMEKEMKALEESALPKDLALQKKLKTIGNYVHDSVPLSNNEVRFLKSLAIVQALKAEHRTTTP